MAFSAFTNQRLLISVLLYVFVSTLRLGKAFDYPHLGAAGVIADEYLPQAQVEGATDQYFPQAGIIGITPPLLFNKALGCLSDKYIYSSCGEAHRLTQSGELNVPPEYADEYCKGPCFSETKHVLDCMGEILKGFVFYNRATLNNLRDTLESGCYGPKRGNFNVLEHIQEANEASKNKLFNPVVYVIVVMIVGWRLLV